MTHKVIITRVLEARENRASFRQKLVQQGDASISLSLNIPGYPKSNAEIQSFFALVKIQLLNYLKANRIEIKETGATNLIDEAGNFCLLPLVETSFSITEIKTLCEAFEEKHELGRLIDVDVTKVISTIKQILRDFIRRRF